MILRPFSVSLSSPLETARGEITSRHGVVIGIERSARESGAVGGDDAESPVHGDDTELPVRGVGEATPLPGWTEPLETCRETLRTRADDPAGSVLASLREKPATRHGLALAIADADARAADVSLATHLAGRTGETAQSVPVNATIGSATPAETAARAEQAVEAGYTCLKLKAGAGAIEVDLQRVAAVRDAVGGAVAIRVDANGSWTESTARRAIDRLATLDVAYVEQPVPATELAAMADLRGRGVDIAADELLTEYDLEDVLDADAADVVVLKPMALGGPDRAVELARQARRAGVDVVVTTTVDAVVARTAAVHVAAAIQEVRPCGLATGALLAEDLAPDPAPITDGAVEVPSGPGIAGDAFDGLLSWES